MSSSSSSSTSTPTSLPKFTHRRQLHSWDCGAAVVYSLLLHLSPSDPRLTYSGLLSALETKLEKRVWTVDLAYLLWKYGVDVKYRSLHCSIIDNNTTSNSNNTNNHLSRLGAIKFYTSLQRDSKRVQRVFDALHTASSANPPAASTGKSTSSTARRTKATVDIREAHLPIDEIVTSLKDGYAAIVLVDQRYVKCEKCEKKRAKMDSATATVSSTTSSPTATSSTTSTSSSFLGHFLLLIGIDPLTSEIVYLDPTCAHASSSSTAPSSFCRITTTDLDQARLSEGTDEDTILINLRTPISSTSATAVLPLTAFLVGFEKGDDPPEDEKEKDEQAERKEDDGDVEMTLASTAPTPRSTASSTTNPPPSSSSSSSSSTAAVTTSINCTSSSSSTLTAANSTKQISKKRGHAKMIENDEKEERKKEKEKEEVEKKTEKVSKSKKTVATKRKVAIVNDDDVDMTDDTAPPSTVAATSSSTRATRSTRNGNGKAENKQNEVAVSASSVAASLKAAASSSSSSSAVTSPPLLLLPTTSSLTTSNTGLTSSEVKLLQKKSRLLTASYQSLPNSIEKSRLLKRAYDATAVFAQEEAGTCVAIQPPPLSDDDDDDPALSSSSTATYLLTCAHCIAESSKEYKDVKRRTKYLVFTSGRIVRAQCIVWDERRDLALMKVVAAQEMSGNTPTAAVSSMSRSRSTAASSSAAASSSSSLSSSSSSSFTHLPLSLTPPPLNSKLYCIGHPGSDDLESTTARKTGYDVIHVSDGRFRGVVEGDGEEVDLQDNHEIGKLKHDCWTYWGHSGAPLVSQSSGELIGLHSSWDDENGMRHGVPIQAIREFVKLNENVMREK